MKTITVKQMKVYNKSLETQLLNFGFIEVDSFSDTKKRFILSSEKLGKITISLDYDSSKVISIFCMIENVNEAIKYFPEMYKNKNNFHEFDFDILKFEFCKLLCKIKYINEESIISIFDKQ